MRLLEYEWYVRGGPKIPYALHHLKERFITAPMFADYKSDLLEVLSMTESKGQGNRTLILLPCICSIPN